MKNAIAYFLYYTGILFIIKKYKLKNKSIVITYHRIMPEEISDTSFSTDGIIVRPDTFNKHMSFVKKHFNILTISNFCQHMHQDDFPNKPSCLVTFDDGWIDNYIYAFPLLKKHSIPAIIFLPINYIDHTKSDKTEFKVFWQEDLGRKLSHLINLNSVNSNSFLKKYNLNNLFTLDIKLRKQVILSFVNKIKQRPYTEINALLNQINEITGNIIDQDHIDKYFNWDNAKEMAQASISFGSHACSHRILTRMKKPEIETELLTSAHKIKEHISNIPLTIAYPNGNSNSTVQLISKDSGYSIGFGTNPGFTTSADNPYDIKRINIHEGKSSNIPLFMMALLGLY